MTFLKLRVSKEEYLDFQKVCERKNKTMSEVLRNCIKSYTNSENLILLDVDNESLKKTVEKCKKDKIRFNDLIKKLLEEELKKP